MKTKLHWRWFCLSFACLVITTNVFASGGRYSELEKIQLRAGELMRQHELHPDDPRYLEAKKLSALFTTSLSEIGYERSTFSDPGTCPICLEEVTTATPCVRLDCGHIWEARCLAQQIAMHPPWICQADGCAKPFRVTKDLLESEAQVLAVAQHLVAESTTLRFCPGRCGLILTYRKKPTDSGPIWTQTCPLCQTVSCPDCGVRHDSQTCAEYRTEFLGKHSEFTDAQIREWESDSNYFRCTACGNIQYRSSGCARVECGRHTNSGAPTRGVGCGHSLIISDGRADLLLYIKTLKRTAEGVAPLPQQPAPRRTVTEVTPRSWWCCCG